MFRASNSKRSLRRQAGATIVEFALVAILFLTLLIGIMELGRWLFTLSAASEATRWGARLAVVCDMNDPQIKERMRAILGSVSNEQIQITYAPEACNTMDCFVTVRLSGATFKPWIPFFGTSVAIPPFTTSLPRESLDSAGTANEVCQ